MNALAQFSPTSEVTQYSATVVLAGFALVGILAGVLYQTGILGFILRNVFGLARFLTHAGFLIWDRTLSSLGWPAFAGLLLAIHLLRWPFADFPPLLGALLGLILLTVGTITVLAYMFIDTERYEVSRGYKALHNPVKGQKLAEGLGRYGDRAGFALLICAILCCVSGFALLNLGLFQSVGKDWYEYSTAQSKQKEGVLESLVQYFQPRRERTDSYADFLSYTLVNLAYLVDLLDVVNKQGRAGIAFVRPTYWPASMLLASFRLFFSFVLLHQLVSLVRHGRLLGESVADLWSPYEPIQRRAAEMLRRQGPDAVPMLLASVVSVGPLTEEQRELIPQVLSEIGPATVPVLSRSLDHPNDDVRAVAIAALGHLKAWWAMPELAAAAADASPVVRLSLATALGQIIELRPETIRKEWSLGRSSAPRRRWLRLVQRREKGQVRPEKDPLETALAALRVLLRDGDREVRLRAAESLEGLGGEAASAADELLALARDPDDTLRAAAARALGSVGGPPQATVATLTALLEPPVTMVLVPALEALGRFGEEAKRAVPAIIPLLQHEDEEVRQAAGLALGAIGNLDASSTPQLVEDLESPDDLERARAAEALGVIGPAAVATAPALVKALNDSADKVRVYAARSLGQLGPEAADESVPALSRALLDPDSSVAAEAARALGELGEVASASYRELGTALKHINSEVRRQAVAAMGKIGGVDAADVRAIGPLTKDEDSNVRAEALLTLATCPRSEVEPILEAGMKDEDPDVRAAAIEAMGMRPKDRPGLMPLLLRGLQDPAPAVKVVASKVLSECGEVPPEAVALLGGLLEDQPDEVRLAAAATLGRLGRQARPAALMLRALAETGSLPLREQGLRALVQIEPADGSEFFAEMLQAPEASLRRLASAGLMKVKEFPPELFPVLTEALSDPDVQVCSNIASICSRLKSLPPALVPSLMQHTNATDDGLRLHAARALRCVPVAGGDQVLLKMLQDPNQKIAVQAATIMLARDPKAEGLEDVLLRAFESGGVSSERLLKSLDEIETPQLALKSLLERLWERVKDPGVRDQLRMLLSRITVNSENSAEEKTPPAKTTIGP